MIRVLFLSLHVWLAAVAVGLAAHPAAAAAIADYQAGRKLGAEYRYAALDAALDPRLESVLAAVIASGTKSADLEAITPRRLPGTDLVRFDLHALGWQESDWAAVAGADANGYTRRQNPLIVPAGWLLEALTDERSSEAWRRFALGGATTSADALKYLGADAADPYRFGLIEGASRVNVAGDAARIVEHRDGVSVSTWATYDVFKPVAGRDPLEALFPEQLRADGSEVFVLLPKVSLHVRGVLPITFLANGDGRLVASAPVELVRDHTETLGPEVVNPASCIVCHAAGPQRFSKNALAVRLEAGLELFAKRDADRRAVEQFHLGGTNLALDRWQEDYTAALAACSGLTPAGYSRYYREAIGAWRADVDLARAAAELWTTPDDFGRALAYASANRVGLSPRLAGLPHGFSVPREAWEAEYLGAEAILETWRGTAR